MLDDLPWQTWFDQAFPRPSPDPTGAPVVRHLAEQAADQPEQAADKPRGRDRAFQDADRLPSGQVQCTATAKSTGRRCTRWAVKGTKVCQVHGGVAPQVREKGLQRVQEAEARKALAKHVGELDLSQYEDPVEAFTFVLSHAHATARALAEIVEAIPAQQRRYQSKLGIEQVRGEVTMLNEALRLCAKISTDAMRLGLESRKAAGQNAGEAAAYLDLIKSAVVNLARNAVYVAIAAPSHPDAAIADLEKNLQELLADG